MEANGYPKKFIQITRKKMLMLKNKDRNYMEVVLDDRQVLHRRKPWIFITYKHGDSKRIRRILDPYYIQVYFKPRVTNKNHLSSLKDLIPFQHQSGAIYYVSCSNCGKQYVGETGRCIAEKISEHRAHTVKWIVSGRALAEHAWDSGHDIDWDSCKMVDKEDHWK